jgi:MOSC domain-containing protein YiiM
VWSVGTGQLKVTQPRQPCFKLGIRMGDAAFVQRFDDARRYGVYLRIDTEGDVGVGDEVALVSRPGHGLTTSALAAIAAAPEREGVLKLRDNSDVPDAWREWAVRQLRRAGGESA